MAHVEIIVVRDVPLIALRTAEVVVVMPLAQLLVKVHAVIVQQGAPVVVVHANLIATVFAVAGVYMIVIVVVAVVLMTVQEAALVVVLTVVQELAPDHALEHVLTIAKVLAQDIAKVVAQLDAHRVMGVSLVVVVTVHAKSAVTLPVMQVPMHKS